MVVNKNNAFLYFNFMDHQGILCPLQFSDPVRILTAQTIDEIIPCLETVQHAVKNGFYVAGYISYEAAPAFNKEFHVQTGNKMPLLWFGIFNDPIHQPLNPDQFSEYIPDTNWKPLVSKEEYNKNFKYIQQSIHQHQTKQVNYTIPFETSFSYDPLSLYKQLADAQSANYSAYLDIDDFSIISASPELFFHLKDKEITTRPMKGTTDRGLTYQEDIEQAQKLKNSPKDQNENQLTVDLMCKELGKIAITGTVNVTNLQTIEKYPTLYQMTSTVTAMIQDRIDLLDIFKALFPCGSITGIPKKDTMNIITEIEPFPREVYCGAIGYITPENEAIFNVPIRTVLVNKKERLARYGVGGGITSASKKESEYKEILIKTDLLTREQPEFHLLESIGLIEGNYLCFAEHIKRLKESAHYFDFDLQLDEIRRDLLKLSEKHQQGKWKVRLLVDKNGQHHIERSKIMPQPHDLIVELAHKPIDQGDLFLYHKTTHREIYKKNTIQNNSIFDTLLWNKNEEITEFTTGNIVVKLNNQLYTPPIKCGLLGGTFREHLIKKGEITERIIRKEELEHCDQIWLINSVREWLPVQLKSVDVNDGIH